MADFSGSLNQSQAIETGAPESNLISGLSRASLESLTKAAKWMEFGRGEQVYMQGDKAKGVYIVLRGKVKLVSDSAEGKTLILRIARAGEMISLSAALSERGNDTSAETTEPSTLCFIGTENLRRLMNADAEVGLRMARELSAEYSAICQGLSTIGLQRTAMSKLAKLLFDMTRSNKNGKTGAKQGPITRICSLTHQEMSQIIGTSRETVTRLLQELRASGVASLKRDILTVTRLERLEALSN
jgi:CRP/FNR family transcriptional regulator